MTAVAQQLPRGRHRLTREHVVSSQRNRILAAVADAVAQDGYPATTVADIIARAGVSRETFYEQFANREECFLAVLDAGADGLLEILAEAIAVPATDPVERLEHLLDAYLDALASEPALAKAYLIDAYGAGPRATRRRIELQQRFVDAVADIFGLTEAAPASSERFACEALVAAVSSLATARVGSGRVGELRALREPMIELVRSRDRLRAPKRARPTARAASKRARRRPAASASR